MAVVHLAIKSEFGMIMAYLWQNVIREIVQETEITDVKLLLLGFIHSSPYLDDISESAVTTSITAPLSTFPSSCQRTGSSSSPRSLVTRDARHREAAPGHSPSAYSVGSGRPFPFPPLDRSPVSRFPSRWSQSASPALSVCWARRHIGCEKQQRPRRKKKTPTMMKNGLSLLLINLAF